MAAGGQAEGCNRHALHLHGVSSSFSCTCICITNFFSLTDPAASASAILLQALHL